MHDSSKAMSGSKVPKLGLRSHQMPMVGLGTWQSKPGEVATAIDVALEAGVRLFDCAFFYRNEDEIGAALKKWTDSGERKVATCFQDSASSEHMNKTVLKHF